MATKSKYNLGQKVIVYGFIGTIADTTDAPEEYGVTFEHGNTYTVPGKFIETDNRPITERIKTLEDAINILGDEHPYCQQLAIYNAEMHGTMTDLEDIAAFLKLRVIMAALNEGWKPNWNDKSEDKWFPWFWIYTKEEIEKMDEEDMPLLVGSANYGSNVGVSVLHATYVPSNSNALCGGALASKTREIAIYAATQFGQLFAELILK